MMVNTPEKRTGGKTAGIKRFPIHHGETMLRGWITNWVELRASALLEIGNFSAPLPPIDTSITSVHLRIR